MKSKLLFSSILMFSYFIFSSTFLSANPNDHAIDDSVCPTCCPFFSYSCDSQIGANGCVTYRITGDNDSRCEFYLYDANGGIVASFPTGPDPTFVQVTLCNGIDNYSFGTSCERCTPFTC